MDLKKVISISGKSGLYEIVAQSNRGIIVESLEDKKRFPVTATQNVSALYDIAIYTYEDEVPLRSIFQDIHKKQDGKKAISHKEDSKSLVNYFTEVLPDYDTERVYTSNIKKVIQWYNLLHDAGCDFTKIMEEEEESSEKK